MGALQDQLKNLPTWMSVSYTPHASGMPTAVQAKATMKAGVADAVPLRPPQPADALITDAAAFSCTSFFSTANSASVMNHLCASGVTNRLQIKPTINMPTKMYMVWL